MKKRKSEHLNDDALSGTIISPISAVCDDGLPRRSKATQTVSRTKPLRLNAISITFSPSQITITTIMKLHYIGVSSAKKFKKHKLTALPRSSATKASPHKSYAPRKT
jgi:hypothetical protein